MPYTVLIIDDGDNTRERYKSIFMDNGFDVLEARDGIEGLNIATEKIPSLVFTGIIMPKMDGFDLIKHLRGDVKTAKIPIMIISHLGRQEDKIKAQELGIRDFIVMDFTPPADIVKRAKLLIEADKEPPKYFLNVDEIGLDAAKLTRDFNLPAYLRCERHYDEKMILSMSADPENPGEFKAKFICPQEK